MYIETNLIPDVLTVIIIIILFPFFYLYLNYRFIKYLNMSGNIFPNFYIIFLMSRMINIFIKYFCIIASFGLIF